MRLRSGTRSPRRGRRRRELKATTDIPGPSTNPATNLLILDIAMYGVSMFAGRQIEKGLLRVRNDAEEVADIERDRSWAQSVAVTAAARTASRSVPGFLLIASGLVAKAIFDRALGSRKSVRRAERRVTKHAEATHEK